MILACVAKSATMTAMSQEHALNTLSPELQDWVEQELKENEQLRWVGQPVLSTFAKFMVNCTGFVGLSGTLIFVAMAWFFFAKGGWLFLLLTAPIFMFCLWGTLTFLSAPLEERWRVKNTVYAITNQRAIIFVKQRRKIKS